VLNLQHFPLQRTSLAINLGKLERRHTERTVLFHAVAYRTGAGVPADVVSAIKINA